MPQLLRSRRVTIGDETMRYEQWQHGSDKGVTLTARDVTVSIWTLQGRYEHGAHSPEPRDEDDKALQCYAREHCYYEGYSRNYGHLRLRDLVADMNTLRYAPTGG